MTQDQTNTPGRDTAGPFTEKGFLAEVCNMRTLFGSKDFWQKPGSIRQLAVNGLAYMYFRCEVADKVAGIYKATMSEYTRRETLGIIHGMVNLD